MSSKPRRNNPIETGTLQSFDIRTGEGLIVKPTGEKFKCYLEDQRRIEGNGAKSSLSHASTMSVPKAGAQVMFMRSFKKRDVAWKWGIETQPAKEPRPVRQEAAPAQPIVGFIEKIDEEFEKTPESELFRLAASVGGRNAGTRHIHERAVLRCER